MAQYINTNVQSLTAQRNLNRSQSALSTSIQRLSSGLRINSAKDDAAGLAISERFTAQIKGLDQAIRNANDGISFSQTAEGALATASNAMQRIRELSVQSANDTNSSSDRQAINDEVQQLIGEINRISSATQFNGKNILDGSNSNLVFQVGANQNQTISVDGVDSRGSQLGARVSESESISKINLAATIAADDLVIGGKTVDMTDVSTLSDLVGAINNNSGITGVQAQKATTTSAGLQDFTAGVSDVTVNGVDFTFTATDTIDNVVSAINNTTAQSGVTATKNVAGDKIELSNTDGADIVVADSGTILGGATADETYHAGIVLTSEVSDTAFVATGTFDVQEDSAGAAGTVLGGGQANQTVNSASVMTRDEATKTLMTMDIALQQVNGLRAELGAVQTRFESTIANLEITTENMTAARSRIQDADFAKETAELTRNQILQQAGISMVSQANSLPQSVLSLLQ